jgi:hypothetical protein
MDPQTGRVRVRTVNVATESYQVGRSYMIRLEASDLKDPSLSRLASQTKLSPQAFCERFLRSVRSTTSLTELGGTFGTAG